MRQSLVPWLCCLCGLVACEKDISVELSKADHKLVVDGKIETGQPPVVILTHSLDYFSKINPEIVAGSFVHNAKVTVASGTQVQVLKEFMRDTLGGARLYYYTSDFTRPATAFVGAAGKSYTLTIEVNNQTYTATTTIPGNGMQLDSLFWKQAPSMKDTNKVLVLGRITDPPTPGNAVRYFTKRNGEPYLPGLNSVADDQVVNGTTFDITFDRGVDKNVQVDFEKYGFFFRGDTVVLKFCNIDRATFDFWRTWDYAYNSKGNPFSSPIEVQGNVQGALGYWGGYAPQYKTIIIPK